MVEVNNLNINLGGQSIISGCNYQFAKTGLYIILGNNGAGKTTLLKSICGLQKPSSGTILLDGKKVSELSLPEKSSIVQYVDDPSPIPAFINLKEYICLGYPKDETRLEKVCSLLKLEPLAEREVSTFSKGQQQKAMLAKLIYGDQPIWLLDEPSNFLDYPSIHNFWKVIQEKSSEKLIITTIHNPEEALKLDAEILVISEGVLREIENPTLATIAKELMG